MKKRNASKPASRKKKEGLSPLAKRIKSIAQGKGLDVAVAEEPDGTIRVISAKTGAGVSVKVKPFGGPK